MAALQISASIRAAVFNTSSDALRTLAKSDTFAEDGPIVDSVQRGLESGGYATGPLVVDAGCTSQSEHPIIAFAALYQLAMAQQVAPAPGSISLKLE